MPAARKPSIHLEIGDSIRVEVPLEVLLEIPLEVPLEFPSVVKPCVEKMDFCVEKIDLFFSSA
jgi:hypothetical protein